MNLLSSLVSSSAFTFPVGSRGNGVLALLITSSFSGITSNPSFALGVKFTIPSTTMTSSLFSLGISLNISWETFFFGAVTWTIPSLSLIQMNFIPPKSLTSCTHPATLTLFPLSSSVISLE
ncbi:120aa long hypothetical protein [Pyrococcus horikoshii OT3]|uniref:Uncharacterized protein n=1 Tax=Pyrococcus horikoshii (strain ATCC 700860 / DSM 12428 / JCM 9974 / NBRC 100139 / OT-3) TaxID=70601 RepID=O58777_PYRHO|nr:120aa long hypothetical protein [Pyrococcus horikoshii OT3]